MRTGLAAKMRLVAGVYTGAYTGAYIGAYTQPCIAARKRQLCASPNKLPAEILHATLKQRLEFVSWNVFVNELTRAFRVAHLAQNTSVW